jgi:hypothetical protein
MFTQIRPRPLPKNGEFGHLPKAGHMCVPPQKVMVVALGLDASEHILGKLAPAVRGH